MILTEKLHGYMPKPIRPGPKPIFAFTLNHADPGMVWTVADGYLTASLPSAPTGGLNLELDSYSIQTIVAACNTAGFVAVQQPGVDGTLSARALLDATGTPATQDDGDHLFIATALVWRFLDAFASALTDSKTAIANMLAQMRIEQSTGEWSDEWQYQTVKDARATGETDDQQNARVIATILQVKVSNLALEQLVLKSYGITVKVVDINWFQSDHSIYTAGAPLWTPDMVTNSATYGLFPFWIADHNVISNFGLALLSDGTPAFGNSSNGQPLVAAFAVIFEQAESQAVVESIMAFIDRYRAAGTIDLAYGPGRQMHTNVAAEVTNNPDYVAGPAGELYSRIY